MRLLKLSIIVAAALCVTAAHAADKKESKNSRKEKSAQSATAPVSEGKINLVVSGMT